MTILFIIYQILQVILLIMTAYKVEKKEYGSAVILFGYFLMLLLNNLK